ncbi:hypothetical protein ACLOJK_005231 [Asimina triloba]
MRKLILLNRSTSHRFGSYAGHRLISLTDSHLILFIAQPLSLIRVVTELITLSPSQIHASSSREEEAPLLGAKKPTINHARDIHLLSCVFLFIFLACSAALNLESTFNTLGIRK